MKKLILVGAIALCAMMAGCGSNDAPKETGFDVGVEDILVEDILVENIID